MRTIFGSIWLPIVVIFGWGEPSRCEDRLQEIDCRMLLPTIAGSLIVDVAIEIDGKPLAQAFDQQMDQVLEQVATESKDRTWRRLFDYVAENSGRFGNLQTVGRQQYRQLTRRFDRNRNDRPDRDEVARFLFRRSPHPAPFRMYGTDSFRDPDRSESPTFAVIDSNSDHLLDAEEIDGSAKALLKLDQNRDERIDIGEVINDEIDSNDAWKPKRSKRWGDVAMDLNEQVDWSMLGYTMGKLDPSGPFGQIPSAISMIDQDNDRSLSADEAKELLKIVPDLRLRLSFTTGGEANIQVASISPPIQSLVRSLDSKNQVQILGNSFSLIVQVMQSRIGANPFPQQRSKESIWSVQIRARGAESPDAVFAWLDQNRDRFLSTREIKGVRDRLRSIASDDAIVKPIDIPETYLIQFGRGDPSRDGQLFASTLSTSKPNDRRPRWAQAMDGNRDGDISRNEFTGTQTQFNVLDTDQDDFIDKTEIGTPD